MQTRAITILNQTGDKTIVWGEEDDEQMTSFIQDKMDKGFVFFIIERRLGGLVAPKRTQLERVEDAFKQRALSIRDEDFAQVFEKTSTTDVVKTPDSSVKTVRKSKNADEVAKNESVAVQPMKGG